MTITSKTFKDSYYWILRIVLHLFYITNYHNHVITVMNDAIMVLLELFYLIIVWILYHIGSIIGDVLQMSCPQTRILESQH